VISGGGDRADRRGNASAVLLPAAGFALIFVVRGAVHAARSSSRVQARAGAARLAGAAIVDGDGDRVGAVAAHNYQYPKQDFEGAPRYVESHRQADEAVVTAGAAMFPYSSYYQTTWTPIDESARSNRCSRTRDARGWCIPFPSTWMRSSTRFFAISAATVRSFPAPSAAATSSSARHRAEPPVSRDASKPGEEARFGVVGDRARVLSAACWSGSSRCFPTVSVAGGMNALARIYRERETLLRIDPPNCCSRRGIRARRDPLQQGRGRAGLTLLSSVFDGATKCG
jgi:hypothetical protein